MATTSSPASVGLYLDKEQHFKQYSNELLSAGFSLSAQQLSHSICIVDQEELENKPDFWLNKPTPFIISGIMDAQECTRLLSTLSNTVGFLNDMPTFPEITFNLVMGLHVFNERTVYSRRVENINEKILNNRIIGIAVGALRISFGGQADEIVETIKVLSRNKQKRLVDVATEIIYLLEPNMLPLESSMDEWLESKISRRS